MRKPAVFLVAVLLGASYGLVKADQEVKIRGRVVYEPTGKPLTNVTVKLLRPDHSFATMISTAGKGGVPELLGTTKTDLNGNFSFETARPGPYDIVFSSRTAFRKRSVKHRSAKVRIHTVQG
jgi:uncharacterized GH25 family protein